MTAGDPNSGGSIYTSPSANGSSGNAVASNNRQLYSEILNWMNRLDTQLVGFINQVAA